MSKGDKDRTKDKKRFNDNFDRIFGDKKDKPPVVKRQLLEPIRPQLYPAFCMALNSLVLIIVKSTPL